MNDIATAAATPAAAPVVARFLTAKPRQTIIPLDWPIALGDVEYRSVTVRRMSTADVGAFMDRMRDAPDGTVVRFPIFDDERGAPVPDAVWDALDSDDSDKLNKAAADFLPARFRATPTSESSTPPTGDTSASSSDASPASVSPT